MRPPVTLKYRAFLSYARADTSWATWLHRRLEGYRIDPNLVDGETDIGRDPQTLRPIFRDREDFAAGRGLTEATIAAVDQAAAMIVVCSAVAAGRPAVNEEVRLFRSRHPKRPLIPVIVDGTFPDNFPPALRFELGDDGSVTERPITILGPDLRETGDGRELGLAKVIAGLTGLDTDVVFRRAERARRRRRKYVATASAVVLGVVTSLGFWSELQRRRFVDFFELASTFQSFEIPDATADVAARKPGWGSPRELARETLDAARQIASTPWSRRKILWFDDKPQLSRAAKDEFRRRMQGVGITIREMDDIELAKKSLIDRYDAIIADYGNPKDRFAYQLLAEVSQRGLSTPLVVYAMAEESAYAKEAICYGAVARVTEIDALFAAVLRGMERAPVTRISSEQLQKCIDEKVKPFDTPDWRQWLLETKAGQTPTTPKLNWD
ncbi:TIR domain-containing protein [Bradyrhizobium sp. USDA 4473]